MNEGLAKSERRGISPILATVILIVITLIAALAIVGFVFGLFGSSTKTASVSAEVIVVPASMASGATLQASSAQGSCVVGTTCGQLALGNVGTANTFANMMKLSYDGQSYSASLPTPLKVTADSTVFLFITALPAPAAGEPASGTAFTGYVATSDGEVIPFTGTFQ